jgi:2-dehydro-3-deoxyphosphogluconate aldolase/(4S)-4-hydroxy-2-oxoglutarate aldolase
MEKLETFHRIKEIGIIPAIRTSNPTDAVHAAEAIRQGGIPVIEVSFAPQHAPAVLEAVAGACSQSMIVGAGTIVSAEGVRIAAKAGAHFIVTPGFSAEAVDAAKELGLAIFAGALSPTEVQVASASGADAVKIFPCFANGDARYLKALRGQYPTTEFIASGGVGLDNCSDYIRAGACAIGVGGEIADFESMAHGDYRVFTVRAKRLRERVHHVRALLEASAVHADES